MTNTSAADTWTTGRLLRWMIEYFEANHIDSPRICAEMLLAHILSCDRMRLYMEVDRPASEQERSQLRELVRRVANHEPVQYILGEALFYGLSFEVSACTLIPRPCTETLVEACIRRLRRSNRAEATQHLLDIGTGSGAIAVTLLHQLSGCEAIATDIDPAILELAASNAERHDVAGRIEFRCGPLFEPLESALRGSFDVICSNPPYISDDEWETSVGVNVKGHEPDRALRGGPDGLDFIRPIVEQAGDWLVEGGSLFVEIPHSTRDLVVDLVRGASWCERSEIIKDGEGLWRVLTMERR